MARKVGNGSKDHGGDSAPLVPLSRRELVTLVGHAAAISAGEWITASGSWINDRTHGQQFKARFLKTSAPTSLEGIQKYLASGMIRGIGPVMPRSCCGPCPGSLPGARNGCSGRRRGRLRTGH